MVSNEKKIPYSAEDLEAIYGKEVVEEERRKREIILMGRQNYYIGRDHHTDEKKLKAVEFVESSEYEIMRLMDIAMTFRRGHYWLDKSQLVVEDVENTICQLLGLKTTLLNYRGSSAHCNREMTPLVFAISNKFTNIAERILSHPNLDVNFEYKTGMIKEHLLGADESKFPYVHPATIIAEQFDRDQLINGLYYKFLSHPDIKLSIEDFQNLSIIFHHVLDSERKIEDLKESIRILEMLMSKSFYPDEKTDFKGWEYSMYIYYLKSQLLDAIKQQSNEQICQLRKEIKPSKSRKESN